MAANERRQHDRRQAHSPVHRERRGDPDRRGRRAADRAGPIGAGMETRRRRLRVQVFDARRAIEASREALKKKKP